MADEPRTDAADHRDAAAAVKARRTNTPRRATTREQVDATPHASPADIHTVSTAHSADTMIGSFIAGQTASADYVIAINDGFEAFYPRGAMQPSCVRLWARGQQVHKTYYAAHGGDQAPTTPTQAKPINEPGGGIHNTTGLTTAIK